MGDHSATHGQTGRASRAVVVDIVNRDVGETELVEDALAASAVTVNVAGDTLVDIVVVDLCIEHSLNTGLVAELIVVYLAAGLDKLGHAHAQDVGIANLLLDHCVGFLDRIVNAGVMELVAKSEIPAVKGRLYKRTSCHEWGKL